MLLEFGGLVYEFQTAGLWRNKRPWLGDPLWFYIELVHIPVEECLGDMQITEGELNVLQSSLVYGDVVCTHGLICQV